VDYYELHKMAKNQSTYTYNPNPPPLPFLKNVFAGGVAGVIEILCMYPLDVVKTRLQLQQTRVGGTVIHYTGMFDCFRKIVQQEGALNLYRGILAPICAEAPKRAVKFSTNESYKQILSTLGLPNNETKMLMSGLLAGLTEAVVNCPFELIKVRMQAKGSKYLNTGNAAVSIIREEGVQAIYKGFSAHCWRNGVWNSLYFALIYSMKRRLLPKPTSKNQELGINFIAGVCSSTLATTCATPFDCVKSRMQNVATGETRRAVWSTLGFIYREEGGLPACFKGLTPRLLRLAPGGGIMLVAFELVTSWMGH